MKSSRKIFLTIFLLLLALFAGCSMVFQDGMAPAQEDSSLDEMTTQIAGTVEVIQTVYPLTIEAELTSIHSEEQSTPAPTARINAENWLTMWLTSPTCATPCWENIIPGETSLTQGIRIVSEIENIKFESLELTPHVNSKTAFARWYFDVTSWGQIITEKNSRNVGIIELHPGEEQKLTLGHLIDSFGEPDSVVRGGCFGEFLSPVSCGVAVVFYDSGIVAYLGMPVIMDDPVNIDSNNPISVIELSLSETMTAFNTAYEKIDQLKWEGYKEYSFPEE